MHNSQEHAAHAGLVFRLSGLPAELADVVPVLVEDHDAAVAVAVSDIHVPVGRIHREARRLVQQRMARIQRSALSRAVRRVELPFGADLQQQFAVTGIFLGDRIRVAAYPYIALVIEVAVVDSARNDLWISPGIDDVALRIKLDHRRRGFPDLFFLGRQGIGVGGPVHDENMVIGIDARAAHISRHPIIRQRLGPERVHLKLA